MAGSNPRFNSFSNDGSFLEMFKKIQEEKQKPEIPPTVVTDSAPPLKKSKPVVMKFSSLKRKNQVLAKPIGTRDKAFSQGEVSDEEDGGNAKSGERDPSMAETVGGSSNVVTSETLKPNSVTEPVVLRDIPTKPTSSSSSASASSSSQIAGKKRRRNRWSDAPPPEAAPTEDEKAIASAMASFSEAAPATSQGTAKQCLTPAQLQQMQEQIEMNKLVARIRAVTEASTAPRKKKDPSKAQYEYDSDEDIEGGTWEHKKRTNEMLDTYNKAIELTEMGKGKHHIGDFLPPEELERFLEKVQAIKEGRDPDFSDYKEHKLDDTNIGFRMLRNAGWSEGEGLGEKKEGIVDPINKGKASFDQAGIGADTSTEVAQDDNTYDSYRKRMMLAYKFRPNPLNNPRRPYY